jgi:hypothetical protein
MSCDVCMHAVANGTMESAVMRTGEELGRLTVDTHCFDRKLCTITAMVLKTTSPMNWYDCVCYYAPQGTLNQFCVVHTIIVPRLLL